MINFLNKHIDEKVQCLLNTDLDIDVITIISRFIGFSFVNFRNFIETEGIISKVENDRVIGYRLPKHICIRIVEEPNDEYSRKFIFGPEILIKFGCLYGCRDYIVFYKNHKSQVIFNPESRFTVCPINTSRGFVISYELEKGLINFEKANFDWLDERKKLEI